jgi:hypothetical protein
MTEPPVPERLAELVREAAATLEAAGEPVTVKGIWDAARPSFADVLEVMLPWALEVAAVEYLRQRS